MEGFVLFWGLRILIYLNDWLVCAVSEEQCRSHVALLLEHVHGLGLRLNYEVIMFLGTVLNSWTATIVLSQKRQQAFKACLGHFQLHSQGSWGLCLCLMGLMAAMVQEVFSPFTLLQLLFRRLQVEVGRLILVASFWPHMPWFSVIPQLLDGMPWKLPQRRDLVSQANRTLFHPFPAGLRLVA